jgi:uncharacterized protein (DUF1330 family)
MKNAAILVAYAGQSERKLAAVDDSVKQAGAVRIALAEPENLILLEGEWPGGAVGLWGLPDAEASAEAVSAAGPWENGSFAVLVSQREGTKWPLAGAGFLLVQGGFTDPVKAAAYNAALPPVYAKFSGYYLALARADSIVPLAGDWEPKSMVVGIFPSVANVEGFWHSDDYKAAKKLRQGGGHFLVAAFSGD